MSFYVCRYVCPRLLSRVRLHDLMDCSCQAPLSGKFSRQEHWSGVAISYSNIYDIYHKNL